MSQLNMFDLTGKKAFITGGAKGIGFSIAKTLAQAGADIFIADIDGETGRASAKEIALSGVQTASCQLDVRCQESIDNSVAECVARFGRIDILVNSAGIGGPELAENVSRDLWQNIIDINMTGLFFVCQAVGRQMIRQGGGNIINIASMSGLVVTDLTGGGQCPYYASKGGVVMITKSLASEWAIHGIRVNAIAPGVTRTAQTAFIFDSPEGEVMADAHARLTPMGRAALPHEMTGAAVFLASEASSYVTGLILLVDGGYTVR